MIECGFTGNEMRVTVGQNSLPHLLKYHNRGVGLTMDLLSEYLQGVRKKGGLWF